MIYPWLTEQLYDLTARFNTNRLPHALLIKGQKGLGKLALAQALAQRLLCASHDQCGECKGCQLLNAGTHPDLRLLQPEEDSKQIKVEQVRNLIEWVNQTAQMGGAKISILAPAHAMNRSSANGLLKIMEEPPQNNHLILVSDDPAALLPTVRSRAQQIHVTAPTTQVATAWLLQQNELVSDWADILSLSHGAPLEALEHAEPDYLERRAAICAAWCDLWLKNKSVVLIVESLSKFELVEVLSLGIELLADIVKLGLTHESRFISNLRVSGLIEQVSSVMAPAMALFFMDRMQKDYRIARGTQNPNQNLMLEALMIDFIDPPDSAFSL